MKKLSNQEMKKIAKSTLALVLAGTFTFSPIAMAEENSSEYETVELQTVTHDEIEEAKIQVDQLKETNPSLIPGDFFYFAKIALEKIKLAFTFDKAEEAELLAEYAAERLAEASELFAAGEEEKALEVIETAIEYMENSQDIVGEDASIGEGTETGEDSVQVNDESEKGIEENQSSAEEASEDQGDSAADKEADSKDENSSDKVEGLLKQNMIALMAAMKHVGNDNARASLQKNIDKTYEKMAKKMAKSNDYSDEAEEKATIEPVVTQPVESDLQPADGVEEQTKAPAEESVDKTMPADADSTAVAATSKKTERMTAKQERKAEKAVVKQERKAEKHQGKQHVKAEKNAKKEHTKGKESKGKNN